MFVSNKSDLANSLIRDYHHDTQESQKESVMH